MPRSKEVVLSSDLVDTVRPGDMVDIHGVYVARYDGVSNLRAHFPVFKTAIECLNAVRVNELRSSDFTPEDINDIRKLSQSPDLRVKLTVVLD
jgi:DNA replication licensing factor MCM2